ncbi:cullin-9-like [Protobothrops mucrosquamatus]|uniref:cullin-9-like n=1 Tax=Protobothrops mucrosquamatus TaxID=103944 RepID=UPI000775BD8D|nr:cullin-9-like [Protobothrops mucrosquamatus]
MTIKRQNGDELVHLGPKHQACPEELIRQRCGHNGCTEYLIRWNVLCLDNGKGNSVEAPSAEGKKQTILMWMSAEDIYANCPTLLGKRKPKEQVVEQNVSNLFPPEDTLDEASLAEMKADVRNLVQRASWQLASTPVPQSSILNTIHILSAYASIGSLMTMFKETGALTLLMKMLCNEEKHIRCSAGKMLRALACHDAGSRAYVLLSLSQQDGIEQQMDFDSRYTLLELFAETTSSEEHYISFEGIPLPQIPGKLLFSLVKRYLCATSLMDKLNITEWGDEQEHCMPSSADSKRKKRTQCEFDFSMAMAHLISELIQVMGWNQNQELCSLRQKKRCQSIFQPQIPARVTIPSAAEVPQKEHSAFKLHSAFPSRKDYVEYLREKLVRGMHVRMLENYEKVSAGDEGVFLHSNNGTPPVQVYWESLGRTYWVHWHMIEIVDSSRNAEQKAQEKVSTLRELLRQNTVNQPRYCQSLNELYSLPCLADHLNKDCGTLSQAEWWELLFFINKLEFHKHHEVVHFIQQNQKLSRLNEEDLIQMCVSVELAQKILQLLNKHCQGTTQIELQNSHVYFKYFFSKGGTEQNCTNAEMLSENYDDDFSEPMKSKKTKEDTLPDRVSSPTPFAVKESDRRLINKFLKIEGLSFPDTLDEKVKDSAAFFNLHDINITKLLSSLQTNSVWKEMAVVLQCCLSDKGTIFEETSHEFLVNVLIQKDLTQQESEKEIQLGMLRLLNKCLDSSWKDVVPWHKCIEPCLSSINSHINDQEIVQEFIKFLHRLAFDNKDCAVVMCSSGIQQALSKVLEKHSSSLSLVTELRDLMNNCEKPASLYQKMTASVLAGCIQMVLNQIEEHRNSHQPIRVPLFDVFLHYLCHGCSTEVKEDKCWEKVEVSSNSQQANTLVDGNVKTYWESNGTTGSHYINVYMHHGVLIQQMSLLVASEDSSYMPARIIVMAGESTSSINTKLNMVNVPPLSTRVILLENMTHFWPIIQIKIKRCQQSGIDTRVRGIEVTGPKPTFWPIFREQLCQRTHLFYVTKAHTWCQEISADQIQLLQLFNRLNNALGHEELFAIHFLPDDEAAQFLGKTCWEALITPLVQRISSPGPNGTSPMSWLLSQYLENLEAATSQTITFNSRVRRLSHLLVHWDPSGPEPEELKSPIQCNRKNAKNKELRSGTLKVTMKKSTSLIGITQCWKDVVQQQVKQFLKSSWQAPDFVERYCSIYKHLRTAMEELFGQKMSFLLALSDGFSEGLLQLPFLSAVHVSDKFAQYIDLWIRDSWTDSTNIEKVQHLQQNLEPISFLAELELANSFEHFYRYYLGERLLSLGNTWLESAVVEQIGLCFPSHYPQQMLKNLSELEQQQQEFHLFQLQQFDKHFLEVDQQGRMKEEEEGEMMQEKSFLQEEETEVKVLLLSPFCWTIPPLCYLKDPIRFFPSSLSQHLSKFADFYIQSQSCFGLAHAKPPRLEWTWLGHAELGYQGCILQVSTLQMYILLCFNSAQEVSVETLLEVTGLSPVFLGHALKPLIKENGILTQRQSILRLNEEVLGHVSDQRLCLLPKTVYLNAEEKICHALEKKKNFICCLLNQILKEEKEIHIDSLVFKVIEACHKQRCASPSDFLGNVCSSADVLSCILYLLNQGFVQRQENFPQLLQYVCEDIPTPALPKNQPQVVFQTVQIKKVPSTPCMEKKQTFSTFR